MKFQDTAIFSDLDGTLFDHLGNIAPCNIDSIRQYTDAGGLFAVSTGRIPDNMMDQIQGVVWNAPGIVLNGAAIYDPLSSSYIHTSFADKDAMSLVIRYALKNLPRLDLQIYTESGIFYVSPEETVYRSFWELHRNSHFVPFEKVEHQAWFKSLLFGPKEDLNCITDFILRQNLSNRFDKVFASTDIVPGIEYLELLPKGINKGSAIKYCRSLPVFSGRKLICIGDYNNDREMLENADISVCPKNSHPDIIKICDVVVRTNNEGAIAGLIDRIQAL